MFWLRLKKLIKICRTPPFLRALLKGTAAGVEHVAILKLVPCNFVVDLGANRGQFSLVARQAFPSAKIIAFEPLPEPVRCFRRVFSDDPLVVLHEYALGPAQAQAEIHVSLADDSSSLLPISAEQSRLFPGTDERETRLIQVKPLDAVLRPEEIETPALLKIDVQGFELPALAGCLSLLSRFTYIYVECSFIELYRGQALADEIIAYLREQGFNLRGVYNLSYEAQGRAIQGDFLFEKTIPASS